MKHILVLLSLIFLAEPALAGQGPVKVLVERLTKQVSTELAPMQGVLYFDKVGKPSTEVDGLVSHVYFSNGDTVKSGDVLVRLNTDFIDQDIRLKQTEIQRLNIRIEHARKDLERYVKLFDQEAASETAFENLSYAHKELIKEREALSVTLDKIRLKRDKSTIRAPFDGIILEKNVDKGNWINSGISLCKIGSTGDLFVNVPVNETLLKFARPGTPVRVILHAFDREVTGKMEGVLPLADEKTKNVSLKVRVPDQEMAVENMSATVYIPTSMKKKLTQIPRDAILSRGEKSILYTVVDHKAKSLALEVLFYKGAYAYSNSACLAAGMTVIVDGNQRLMENQPVHILGDRL
ncbi:efflux RND transporter periplasmic adaptor subunit [Desulfosarcina ovata]|nr:efflux RND transporter periplasmic adaptor subunit [Desulfosarcina ovata]